MLKVGMRGRRSRRHRIEARARAKDDHEHGRILRQTRLAQVVTHALTLCAPWPPPSFAYTRAVTSQYPVRTNYGSSRQPPKSLTSHSSRPVRGTNRLQRLRCLFSITTATETYWHTCLGSNGTYR